MKCQVREVLAEHGERGIRLLTTTVPPYETTVNSGVESFILFQRDARACKASWDTQLLVLFAHALLKVAATFLILVSDLFRESKSGMLFIEDCHGEFLSRVDPGRN